MTQTYDEFLWRRAAELLEIDWLPEGKPQEVSANYDAGAHSCSAFADFGTGGMTVLGVALSAQRSSGYPPRSLSAPAITATFRSVQEDDEWSTSHGLGT